MSDYVKLTNFATKDALASGNPLKVVSGTEINAEFDAIATAVATKFDSADLGVTVQAYDAQLADIAGLTPTDNGVVVGNGTNFVVESGATLRTSIGAASSGANADITSMTALTAPTVAANPMRAADIQAQLATAFTTGGTGTAFTLTPTPAITAYAANQEWDVVFSAACGAAPTFQVSGLASPPNLVKQNADGTYSNLAAGDFPSGWTSKVKMVSATQALVRSLPPPKTYVQIQPVEASVAANALTVTLNPTTLDFRSTTLGSGAVNTRALASAISLTISSGSTLGTVNGVASRIAILAIDNAGTVELAAVNIAGGVNLDETTLINTTAEGGAGAADSATVIYSQSARTGVPFRVVGFVESTQATAGTWATAPSLVQGYGGQATLSPTTITSLANIATTSGTAIDVTGIPNWVKRITINFMFVSTNGMSTPMIQIGDAGGIEATGYYGSASVLYTTVASVNLSTGFVLTQLASSASSYSGSMILSLAGDGVTWAAMGITGRSDSAVTNFVGGLKTLSAGPLDRIRLTTVNGTDTFDLGAINVVYE